LRASHTPPPHRAAGHGIKLADLHVVKGLQAVVVIDPSEILDLWADGWRGGL
jgi:hypothetical protein